MKKRFGIIIRLFTPYRINFVKMATIKIEIPHNPFVKNSNVFL